MLKELVKINNSFTTQCDFMFVMVNFLQHKNNEKKFLIKFKVQKKTKKI